MKVTLNLANASNVRERHGLAWAVPSGLAAALVLAMMGVVAVRDFRDYRRVRRSVLEVQQEEARVREQENSFRRELDRPQLREMYRRTGFINNVIDKKQFAMTELVGKVTPLLPGDVRLDGLSMTQTDKARVVRMIVSADKEESLEKFLIHLEDSTDFSDVTIISQGLAKAGEDAEPATVACTARYLAEPAPQGAEGR
jgi:hypothetical protein